MEFLSTRDMPYPYELSPRDFLTQLPKKYIFRAESSMSREPYLIEELTKVRFYHNESEMCLNSVTEDIEIQFFSTKMYQFVFHILRTFTKLKKLKITN